MPKKPDQLETIDLGVLATVNGGRSSAAASGGSKSSDANSQLMTLLTEITTELQQLTQNRDQQDPFMRAIMLMQAMQGGGSPFQLNAMGAPLQQFNAMKKR